MSLSSNLVYWNLTEGLTKFELQYYFFQSKQICFYLRRSVKCECLFCFLFELSLRQKG